MTINLNPAHPLIAMAILLMTTTMIPVHLARKEEGNLDYLRRHLQRDNGEIIITWLTTTRIRRITNRGSRQAQIPNFTTKTGWDRLRRTWEESLSQTDSPLKLTFYSNTNRLSELIITRKSNKECHLWSCLNNNSRRVILYSCKRIETAVLLILCNPLLKSNKWLKRWVRVSLWRQIRPLALPKFSLRTPTTSATCSILLTITWWRMTSCSSRHRPSKVSRRAKRAKRRSSIILCLQICH